MDSFKIDKKFDSFEAVLLAKRSYEQASNTVLVIRGSNLLNGDGDFVKSKVYDRIIFKCKAGEERKPQSKGIRKTSTYKMNCPFTVNISLTKDKLTVTHVNLNHENHQTNRATFLSYPENMRLTESEVKLISPMLACGASKQLVKAFVSKDREAPVPLKLLHNLDSNTKQQRQGCNRKEDFQRLIEMMMQVPNGRVRIIKNEENELLGVFFQDERMAAIFEKYADLLFFDATHNMNNANMPLFIQLCVDGNGDSEIVSLYVCVSESREGVGSMIDEFQKLNPSHIKTKVILGDKDFADRRVYLEKFENAVLKICLFHVLRTFRREITSYKRGVTNAERESALEVLQRLVYSTSEEEYNAIYNELLALKLEKVEDYYNTNWHRIRDEWTLFGMNEHCTYLNTTNNRMESLNQKLKFVGNRNANLQTFFENLTISVSNISSEKDLKALRGTMRRSRLCYDDEVLKSYHDLLTPFSFQKIEVQYELAAKVDFLSFECTEAVVNNKNNDKVSETGCSCLFFSSMQLPCRHIIQFLIMTEINPFAPELCATRWTKKYYNDSHPALSTHVQVASTKPVYVQVRDPNRVHQFKKNNAITKEIRNIANNLSSNEQSYFTNKLKDLRNEMINTSSKRIRVSDECVENPFNFCAEEEEDANMLEQFEESALDLSINRHSTPDNNSTNHELRMATDQESTSATHETSSMNQQSTMATSIDLRFNKENISSSSQRSDTQPELPIFRKSQPFSISSSIDNIKVPQTVKSVGRPKGRLTTVIGTKIKNRNDVAKSVNKINEDQCVKRFVDKTQTEQTFTIIKWLTLNEFGGTKKITFESIVNDANVFQRLRNDEVFLGHLKQFCDNSSFEYIKNEVFKLHEKPWICSKCNLNLDGEQVQCDICLDWFHLKCVQVQSSKRYFICSSC